MKTKKIIILVGLVTLCLSSYAFASPGNVRFTVHNLSNNTKAADGFTTADGNRNFYSNTESQVCIFCHSPHNASPASPLWNKASLTGAATAYRMYTSSPTLTLTTRASSLPAGSPSLLCLSCHDGKTAINVLHNASSGVAASGSYSATDKVVDIGGMGSAPVTLQFGFGTLSPANLGGTDTAVSQGDDLTNDHPIGFSYTAAQGQSTTKLFDVPTVLSPAKSNGAIRFFGATKRMECSTCHDPHVNYTAGLGAGVNTALRPFLVMSNTGSALCLSCHNK